MSRWNKKKKKWLLQHARQSNRNKRHGKGVGGANTPGSTTQRFFSRDSRPYVVQTPPKNFSLIDNPEETMAFFSDFAHEVERNQYGTHFFVDSRNVESVTVDALIYLIAILQNDKQNYNLNYSFSGNFPESEEAKKVYTESGFTDYVESKMKILPSSNNRMRIICGTNNHPQSAKELSRFVMESLGKEKKDIHPLQKVLVELILCIPQIRKIAIFMSTTTAEKRRRNVRNWSRRLQELLRQTERNSSPRMPNAKASK